MRLRMTPALAVSPQVGVPTVAGILRPTILLPLAIVSGLAPDELEAILAHELAHLRRYDHLVNLIQRLIEAFLFFHPAVWWLSRRIRIEREHCCDDLVVAQGAEPSRYAASLLHVAELAHAATKTRPSVLGLHVVRGPSALRHRIARLVGSNDEPAVRLLRAWPLVAVCALCSLLLAPVVLPRETTPASNECAAAEQGEEPGWGDAVGGLRARLLAVAPNTDEQKPNVATAKADKRFAHAGDITFLIELKNVSDKAIPLQGTRYGDTVAPPWPGKSVSDQFAPYLFACVFFDKDGKRVKAPAPNVLDTDAMLVLSGGQAETVQPGQSLVCLLRPARWNSALAPLLVTGKYQAQVHYHGPTPAVVKELKRVWPNKPLNTVWTGDVASGRVAFSITDTPGNRPPKLVWGPANKGLQAAAAYRNVGGTAQAWRDTATRTFPQGARLHVEFHIKNVSEKNIVFWSETWIQDDKVVLIDAAGNEKPLAHAWYSGWTNVEHWTLKPGQVAVVPAINIGVADIGHDSKDFDHPIGGIVAVKPGEYRLRHEIRFNSWQRTDKSGQTIPRKDDWQGTLVTGATRITVRKRKAEDNPATFTARLRFQAPDGKPVEAGEVKVYRQSGMRLLQETTLKPGVLEVPGVPFAPLAVEVRAPGFEESRLYDVAVTPAKETTLTLTRAEPLRFRLVTRDGKPVAGAKVRFFNRSAFEAGSGPYPINGLKGPIWATSDADGKVVLASLQKIDPNDRKLGNNIYWFYVEPPGLAPLFIGPVQAGQNLGKIIVSPFLEVRGEVHGTKAELDAFAAEWDQPEPMKRGNGKVSWSYAESRQLETTREGNKLTFHLTGLRPGALRIIARFQRGGKSISHEYSRRVPNEDDVVSEVQLTQSRNDLVIQNKRGKSEKSSGVTP
jgi:hypothetical protein